MSNSLLFRAIPVVQLPSHEALLEAADFELVQIASSVEQQQVDALLRWYWKCVGELTLLNQGAETSKRFQGGREEIFSIADVSKAIARAVGDLWNYRLRNVLSAVTYFPQPTDVIRFRTETITKPTCWAYAQFYQTESFVKFKCVSFKCVSGRDLSKFTADMKVIPSVNLETPVLSTKVMIAHLVNAFVARDLQTLDFLKVQLDANGGVSRELYTAWKQVIMPLTCLTVPARPDEELSGLFLSQRQGLTMWHGNLTAPIMADMQVEKV